MAKRKPTGFVGKCSGCGVYVSALSVGGHGLTMKDAGKELGAMLWGGQIVEPRYGDWSETINSCECKEQP